jgi:hypothetical protein
MGAKRPLKLTHTRLPRALDLVCGAGFLAAHAHRA